MPKPLPPSLAETFSAPQEAEPLSSDVLRVLGGIGLPGDQELTRMDRSGTSAETDGLSWEIAKEAHLAASKLFSDINPNKLPVPALGEFVATGVDFAKLKTGYEAYEAAGMIPELVFAAVNLPLDTWKEIYSALRQWQDTTHPNSAFKLQKRGDGDGLYVNSGVAKNWDDINQFSLPGQAVRGLNRVVWKALIVPTGPKGSCGLAINTSHDLSKQSEEFTTQVEVSGQVPATAVNAHMPVGAYLTLQATHTLKDTPLLDKGTWTWNGGTFKDGNNLRAPASFWGPGDGQVDVSRDDVGYSDDFIGARLPVWG